jgi:hypothetical protein
MVINSKMVKTLYLEAREMEVDLYYLCGFVEMVQTLQKVE